MEAISLSKIIPPAHTRPANFLPGASNSTTTTSRVPSRLPSPTPSNTEPHSPTLPCILPPSPSASPILLVSRKTRPKASLFTLPPEILRHILWYCSRDYSDVYWFCYIERKPLDLPVDTTRALYGTCRALRQFLLQLGLCGVGLVIKNTSGLTRWSLSPPIWAGTKKISLRWDDAGTVIWPWGIEEQQWELIKSRSDAIYGPQIPVEEQPPSKPKRADQINMTGQKPKDPKAYMKECRAYLQKAPLPPRQAKKHRPGVKEEIGFLLMGCKKLEVLSMDFPGALEAFTEAVMKLQDEEAIFDTLKTLKLRNGNEMCFPPPKNLCVAISRFRSLEELSVHGNCGFRGELFSVRERRKRGVFVAEGHYERGDVVGQLWGWECDAIEMAPKPAKLKVCKFLGMPGLGEGMGVETGTTLRERKSSGVWNCAYDGWPADARWLVEGRLELFVGEVVDGWVWKWNNVGEDGRVDEEILDYELDLNLRLGMMGWRLG